MNKVYCYIYSQINGCFCYLKTVIQYGNKHSKQVVPCEVTWIELNRQTLTWVSGLRFKMRDCCMHNHTESHMCKYIIWFIVLYWNSKQLCVAWSAMCGTICHVWYDLPCVARSAICGTISYTCSAKTIVTCLEKFQLSLSMYVTVALLSVTLPRLLLH